MHVLSGGLLFGAIFMATDPITSPITKPARIYFGFALGVITFFIRLFGALPEGVLFSILIMNMFVSTFDYHKWTNSQFTKKGNIIFDETIIGDRYRCKHVLVAIIVICSTNIPRST